MDAGRSRTAQPAPERGLDPELTAPHLSNRILKPFILCLEDRYGGEAVSRMLEEAGLPAWWVRDAERWVSGRFLERMLAVLLRRIGGLDAPPPYDHPFWQTWREAGWSSWRPRAMGSLWPLAFAFGTPRTLLRAIVSMNDRGTRLTAAELVREGPGVTEVRFRPVPGMFENASNCWSRRGLLEAIPTLWGLPRAEVDHPECLHDPAAPGSACRYVVRYRAPRAAGRARALALPAAGLALGAGAAWAAGAGDAMAWAAGLGAAAGLAVEGWRRFLAAERRRGEDAGRLAEQVDLGDQRYQELWNERMTLRRALLTNRKISGYLSADVVERLTADPDAEVTLGGVRTDAAVLFVDIVDFTPRCETAAPEAVVSALNRYFAHVDPVVARHGGIIDKRLGDGLMVVFASRDRQEGPVALRRRAVACALDVLACIPACNADLAATGEAPLAIRAGLAAGPLVQGNMGSGVKLEYTVIGDVVNLAARLQRAAEPGTVLVEASCLEPARDLAPGAVEREVSVKGKERPVRTFQAGG